LPKYWGGVRNRFKEKIAKMETGPRCVSREGGAIMTRKKILSFAGDHDNCTTRERRRKGGMKAEKTDLIKR